MLMSASSVRVPRSTLHTCVGFPKRRARHWRSAVFASPRSVSSRLLPFAAQIGLRVILTMTNFYLEFGGIRWYVDNTVSTSAPQEYFYNTTGPIAAYQTWVRAREVRGFLHGRK